MAQLPHGSLRFIARSGPTDEALSRDADPRRCATQSDALPRLHDIERLEALSTLGRLVAGAAHDLRNVVTGVMGHAHLILERSDVPPEVTALAREIVDASRCGTHLVQSLVRLGDQRPRGVDPVDLGKLVLDYAGVLRMAAGSRMTLHLTADSCADRVLVDPADIERVLLNLVVNARDAMPLNGGTVHVSVFDSTVVRPSDVTSPVVVVEVRDNGMGMDAMTMSRMFEPFYTTKGDAGTGLGLAVVQQLVGANGGFLEVESGVGQGTLVRVCLPAETKAGGRVGG